MSYLVTRSLIVCACMGRFWAPPVYAEETPASPSAWTVPSVGWVPGHRTAWKEQRGAQRSISCCLFREAFTAHYFSLLIASSGR